MSATGEKRSGGGFEVIRWSAGYAVRRRGRLALVVGSILVQSGIEVLKPWPMAFLLDYVLGQKARPPALERFVSSLPGGTGVSNLIAWAVAATVLLFLAGWAIGLANTYLNISWAQRMVYDLAGDLFAKLQALSLRFHSSRAVGDNIRRVTTDCGCISIIVKDALLPAASALVSLIAMFTVMWRVDHALTIIALMVVPWMALVFRFYARPMMDRSYEEQEADSRIYALVERTFAGIPIVQAFSRESDNDQQFRMATGNALAATLRSTRVQMQFKVLIGLATAVGTAAILWKGGQYGMSGRFDVGTIWLFLSYLAALYAPLDSIMYSSSTIQGAAGSARRVREILDMETEVADKPGAEEITSARGHVQIENVYFNYRPEQPVLRGVSIEASPGETVALVGATGAGKTTIAGLVARFFDPISGRVLLDGKDLRNIRLKSLRKHVAMVLQEPFLFPMTVAENIAYGKPDATFGEVEAAARAANAHDFILQLPGGYEAVIGERGATLSGGQRQRLSIARALLKNAPVLILDEPTSALDAETEKGLMEALERLTQGRTTFIIAHRLSTVRRANRIVVVKEGQIVESGTHADLLARKSHYARFYQLQSGGCRLAGR
jgi:ATP-binding cassette subfamily B protein/subfamily B ATP-binding cassette protein MsbA